MCPNFRKRKQNSAIWDILITLAFKIVHTFDFENFTIMQYFDCKQFYNENAKEDHDS